MFVHDSPLSLLLLPLVIVSLAGFIFLLAALIKILSKGNVSSIYKFLMTATLIFLTSCLGIIYFLPILPSQIIGPLTFTDICVLSFVGTLFSAVMAIIFDKPWFEYSISPTFFFPLPSLILIRAIWPNVIIPYNHPLYIALGVSGLIICFISISKAWRNPLVSVYPYLKN